MRTICLVGGGNLTHATIGMISRQYNITVSLLTNHPNNWHHNISVNTPEGIVLNGNISQITSEPRDVIPNSDIVLFCLPAFCVENTIKKIKPYLKSTTILGSIVANTGFFLFCHQHLPRTAKLFGFQRVPYVARVVEYGKSANLLGYRDELFMATENIDNVDSFRQFIELLFNERTTLVNSFYEVTLSNSNPILHTGRLYTMWKDWDGKPFKRCSLFYKEWTDDASELEVKMDVEFFELLNTLHVDTSHIDTLLQHYEATTPAEMTKKIRSILPLSSILSPMKETPEGWLPDFESRYFTEDFPFGLRFIVELAKENHINTPNLNTVFEWGEKLVNTSILH